MAKIKINPKLYARAKKASEELGYSSIEEYITHIIETALEQYETDEADEKVADQLRGLGYID